MRLKGTKSKTIYLLLFLSSMIENNECKSNSFSEKAIPSPDKSNKGNLMNSFSLILDWKYANPITPITKIIALNM